MSNFSDVDGADDPDRLVGLADQYALAASRMKHYVMAAHALRPPEGPILDLGCRSGHDLVLLASAGLRPVGVDPSAVMLSAAIAHTSASGTCVVRAVGEALPFRDGAFAGCRIERVLLHVLDPLVVLAEAVRCLRTGALITLFEPDWSSFRVASDVCDESAGWIAGGRNPHIGAALWRLVEEAGCEVQDRIEELSVWRSLTVLGRVVDLALSIRRAVSSGRISAAEADRWIIDQRARNERGEFMATIPKVLIVATKR